MSLCSPVADGRRSTIRPDGPLDVHRTLAPLRTVGTTRFAADGVWRAVRTADGPATVRIRAGADLRSPVEVWAWGPGGELARAAVPDLLGLHDDPVAYRPAHPLLREAHRRHPGLRTGRTKAVTEVLLRTIVEQKVPSADAARSWRAVRRAFGEAAPGPAALALPPDPARLAELAYVHLHRFGIERTRAEPLLAACRAASRLERLADRTPGVLEAGLRQLRGIGPWTASVVVRTVLGDADTVVVGDYNLPSIVAWALAGERVADDVRMLELLEPERPHRARAVRLAMVAGPRRPRRGPRLGPTAIAGC